MTFSSFNSPTILLLRAGKENACKGFVCTSSPLEASHLGAAVPDSPESARSVQLAEALEN